MFRCMNCQDKLTRIKNEHGIYWACSSCKGRAVGLSLLRRTLLKGYINGIWQEAHSEKARDSRKCPSCQKKMVVVPSLAKEEELIPIDVCKRCHFLWFDPDEFEKAPASQKEVNIPKEEFSPQGKEAIGKMKLEGLKSKRPHVEMELTPDTWGDFLVGMFGLPVEAESSPVRKLPILTWFLATIISVFSLLALTNLDWTLQNFALYPDRVWEYGGLTIIFSFFLHGSLWHLIGNVYFLLILGDNIEEYLGRFRYLFLIAFSAIIGSILHVLFDPNPSIPVLGASGGISGILVFYFLKYPHSRIELFVGLSTFRYRWVSVSAQSAIIFWTMLQLLEASFQLTGASHISALSHLGGALVGTLFFVLYQNDRANSHYEDYFDQN